MLPTPFFRGLESCPLPEDDGSGDITLLWTLTSLKLQSIAPFSRKKKKNKMVSCCKAAAADTVILFSHFFRKSMLDYYKK
jgi:hypothetical protein